MSFLKMLLDRTRAERPAASAAAETLPADAETLPADAGEEVSSDAQEGRSIGGEERAAAAVKTIEGLVEIKPGMVEIAGSGPGGRLVEAVGELERATRQQPRSPLPHYLWASALHLAQEAAAAEAEMRKCAEAHPEFPYAGLALEGWKKWQSMFMLPPWGPEVERLHPVLATDVKTHVLLAVRVGLLPRAVLFSRDAQDDFQDLKALRTCRIDLASVISEIADPQIVGVYMKIHDDPDNPYDVEVLQAPFKQRGDRWRAAYEYLCLQDDVEFVVVDGGDRIKMRRRLPFSPRMMKTNRRLWKLLAASDGEEISMARLAGAVSQHQKRFSHAQVDY